MSEPVTRDDGRAWAREALARVEAVRRRIGRLQIRRNHLRRSVAQHERRITDQRKELVRIEAELSSLKEKY